jgi:hypothetical protein
LDELKIEDMKRKREEEKREEAKKRRIEEGEYEGEYEGGDGMVEGERSRCTE